MIETERPAEKAILVGINYPGQSENETNEYLNELAFLADTAGAVTVKRFIQKLDIPNPATFIGSGKTAEIAGFIAGNKIDLAIFD